MPRVWAAYLQARSARLGKVGGATPIDTPKRRKLIRDRLKDHSVEQLEEAVRGVWRSSWHVEQGQTSLELVLRDAAHVERFAAQQETGPAKPKAQEAPECIRPWTDAEIAEHFVAPYVEPGPYAWEARMPPLDLHKPSDPAVIETNRQMGLCVETMRRIVIGELPQGTEYRLAYMAVAS